MSAQDRVTIRKLPTGVPALDEILGVGLPEFSFNIIAGAPGCEKTTLAHQVVFANATPTPSSPLAGNEDGNAQQYSKPGPIQGACQENRNKLPCKWYFTMQLSR